MSKKGKGQGSSGSSSETKPTSAQPGSQYGGGSRPGPRSGGGMSKKDK